MEDKMKKIVCLIAALAAAGLAQAQSHSVTNYSNPPGKQADTKAGTEATPGRTATASQQDAGHPDKGKKDQAANKGKPGKSAKRARRSAAAAADRPASADKSQGPTASVQLDGASKGGAEAALQVEPSERNLTPDQKAAFDVRGAGGSASSNKK
jgi:hypothetical protein